jgi:cytochrome c553
MNSTSPPSTENTSVIRSLLPRRALQWFGVALTLGGVAALGAIATVTSGMVPLSAVPADPEGVAHLLHYTSSRSVAAHAKSLPASSESLTSAMMVMRGAAEYAVVCANCHGAPGYGQSPIALSMRPEPPVLIDASKTYSDDELFYIAQNGIRMTGMPAWSVTNRPDEIWALVAFIKATPTMDGATYTRLARGTADTAKRSAGVFGSGPTSPQAAAVSISAFVPTTGDRPYLPGDPQTLYSSPERATLLPRTGFVAVGGTGDATVECASCHAADGSGRAGSAFPNLTLLSPQYIYDALHAFASGQRQSGIMWPIAANLSDDQMRTVAARLGASPALPSHDDPGADGSGPGTPGAQIAASGIGATQQPGGVEVSSPWVERCTSCHIQETGLGQIIPPLDGQRAAYLRMQLHAFKEGGRGDTAAYNPMVRDTHNLTDADIVAVASFYASLPPRTKK